MDGRIDRNVNMNQVLAHSLQYKNQLVLDRYSKDFPDNKMSAEHAFEELVKYMWLCLQHKQDQIVSNDAALNFDCVMQYEMREIDDMWHTFLLFTKDYHDFCMQYLGEFFHHQPLNDEEKNKPLYRYEVELSRYLNYVYDKLGEETLLTWFGEQA